MPTTKWRYLEPSENGETTTVEMTEDEILAAYYPYWRMRMRLAGKEDLISPQACIEDWVVINWAEPC